MNGFAAMIIPVITAATAIAAVCRKTDFFGEFALGAKENLSVCADILPSLIALVTAVSMFSASGAADLLASALSGVFAAAGFPAECFPLALIRPISGSGALAMFESVLRENHPDSFAGRTASVILGSTETTFYTLAVYYGAAGIKKTRHSLAAALTGDITGFIVSVLAVNLIFGMK
ncbi:MAG: spore maturation protein [Ruminococcus sp.]|nr:spore maturation protein [Ruminococcus sp.]